MEQLNTSKFANSRISPPRTETFEFLSKIIGYEEDKVIVVEMNVKKLRREHDGTIRPQQNITRSELTLLEEGQWQFDDYLEIFGFNKQQYGGFTFLSTIDTSAFLPQETK